MSEAYRIEVDTPGCEHCRAKRTWTIVGPDEVGIGTSWEDEELALDIADLMNMAHDAGRETRVAVDKASNAAMAGKVIPEANLASTLTSDEEADMLKDHPTRRTP